MISVRTLNANRKNARASTGPRTEMGKARARQNSRKHGLAATQPDHDIAKIIENLVRCLTMEFADDLELREAAYAVADADIHLRRVLAVKHTLIGRSQIASSGLENHGDNIDSEASAMLFDELESLERYERRAFSRRKTVTRNYEKLLTSLTCREERLAGRGLAVSFL